VSTEHIVLQFGAGWNVPDQSRTLALREFIVHLKGWNEWC